MVAIYINKHRKKEQTMNNEQPESTTKDCKDCKRKDICSLYESIKRQEKAAINNEVKEKQPYFANAQVGDKVVCVLFGEGVISNINSHTQSKRIIAVKFKNTVDRYTIEGQLYTDTNQTLFYSEDAFIIIASKGIEPKRGYIPRIGDVIKITEESITYTGVIKQLPKGTAKYYVFIDNNLRNHTTSTNQKITFVKHNNTVKEAINSEEFNLNF